MFWQWVSSLEEFGKQALSFDLQYCNQEIVGKVLCNKVGELLITLLSTSYFYILTGYARTTENLKPIFQE